MTEQEPIKVYELAKELGIDSISLIDKLKGLNIVVKNHMSGLEPNQADLARSSLDGKKKSDKPDAKKRVVSKTRKKADPEEAAPKKEAASPIIRRRTRSDADPEVKEVSAPITPKVTKSAPAMTEEPPVEAQPLVEQEIVEIPAQEIDQPVATAPVEAPVQEAPSTPPAPPASRVSVTTGKGSAAKITTTAPSTPPPVRRSVLKIVEASAPPSPVQVAKSAPENRAQQAAADAKSKFKGTTQDRDGVRIIKMTKENIDQMAEEEAAKKRGAGGREGTIRPEDVRLADYRKKEMVFLPKKKKLPVGKELQKTQITTPKAQKRVVEMQDTITVAEFAQQVGVKGSEVIRKLMGMGQMATMNQAIDFDTATLIASEYQYEVKNVAFKEAEVLSAPEEDKNESLQPRPPIVTIMGHVDHGKTTLLDAVREANVAANEAGGITQHIGAYTIEKDGHQITFIDTPGHEAFTLMRARGANVTDIVVLVVAADDGVMPQTREALSHAKAAGVPIVVAVNKIDKPGANIDRIKQALAELELLAEDWGGDTMFIPVSALQKTNLDKLLEAILLNAEVLQLKANPHAPAKGTVLEARLDRGRGPVVSLLIRRGTLRVGDPIVAGQSGGRVRAMTDHLGKPVESVTPGMAAEVLGFEAVPNPGDAFDAVPDEANAKRIIEHRINQVKAKLSEKTSKMSLDALFAKIQAGETKELRIVLKADVGGSVEAIRDSLAKLSTEKVKVAVIHAGTGGITESDVLLANASNAIIIGFNVRPETKARAVAESEHIDVKCYNIIYELMDDVKKAMAGLLEKKKVEKFLGRAEVRQTFSIPKAGVIAGSAVIDGKILRGANVRLLRDSRVIYEGKMTSLKRFKDDAKEVAQGYECGIGLENYNDIKPGDIIEAYQIELVTQELTS